MPNLLRVRTILTGVDVVGGGVNTLYFLGEAAEAPDVRGLVNLFWDAIMTRTSTGVTWTGDDVVDIIDEETGQITAQVPVTSLSASGDVVGEPCPPATQGLVRLPTGVYRAGRQIRGRVFVPGVPEEHSSGGAPSTPYVTTLTTAAETLVADSFTVGAPLVVYSRPVPADPGPSRVGQGAIVNGPSTWAKFAVLRSRRD